MGLEELLERSDVISIHCNLTWETEHLLNADTFRKMIRKPVVINTARGPVIEQNALLQALNSNQIQSAGIDVFNTELPGELPANLLEHPGIIATGHYGWYSENSHIELQKRAADNLLGLLTGKIVEDCLNP